MTGARSLAAGAVLLSGRAALSLSAGRATDRLLAAARSAFAGEAALPDVAGRCRGALVAALWPTLALVVLASFVAAVVAARLTGPPRSAGERAPRDRPRVGERLGAGERALAIVAVAVAVASIVLPLFALAQGRSSAPREVAALARSLLDRAGGALLLVGAAGLAVAAPSRPSVAADDRDARR